eukprot:TRINITY_DN8837_c0_g1_i1.p1 TRINITY_DN8837_c0_g1~~TRINITY_DN8837_c0_g1_i1.p1  ORF type:complete len:899 (+),score=85.98 TRINITY_DN8837_c0_g1_i1:52-2748(+)
MPDLRQLAILRSAKPLPRGSVTVATQLSVDRLGHLRNLTAAWPGAVAAAILIADSDPDAIEAVQALWKQTEAAETCHLDVVILSLDDECWYPINAMRNVSLDISCTELVVLLDVDQLPCGDLQQRLLHEEHSYENLVHRCRHRHAIVLPSFEFCEPASFRHIQNRYEAETLWEEQELRPFCSTAWPVGHAATQYPRWFQAGNTAYRVAYEDGFEPYVIVNRWLIPFYDERFDGYGRNKIFHLFHLDQLEFEFWVIPSLDAFLVEQPHRKSESWNRTLGPNAEPQRLTQIKALYEEAKGELLFAGCAARPRKRRIAEDTYFGRWNGPEPPELRHWAESYPALCIAAHEAQFVYEAEQFPYYVYRDEPVVWPDDALWLVTQCSEDRFAHLTLQVQLWEGPICVTVFYWGQIPQEGTVIPELEALRKRHSHIRICICGEGNEHNAHAPRHLYPINFCRNRAMDLVPADSCTILVVDVDIVPSCGTCHAHLDPYIAKELDLGNAVILPSWQFTDETAALSDCRALPRSKDEVTRASSLGTVCPFHIEQYPVGHRATDHSRWLQSNSEECYCAEFEIGFEPYAISKKARLPPFDERFRGYGRDKIAQCLLFHSQGGKYVVAMKYFSFAIPHQPSADRLLWHGETRDRVLLARTEALFNHILRACGTNKKLGVRRTPLHKATETLTLVLTEDFVKDNWRDSHEITSGANNTEVVCMLEHHSTFTPALRVALGAGLTSPESRVGICQKIFFSFDCKTVVLVYSVRFADSFCWGRGGSLPGLHCFGGALICRFHWTSAGESVFNFRTDPIAQLQNGRSSTFPLAKGQWHKMALELQVHSCEAGHARAWIDEANVADFPWSRPPSQCSDTLLEKVDGVFLSCLPFTAGSCLPPGQRDVYLTALRVFA